MKEFKVKYEDNTGCGDGILQYKSEEEANKAIEDEFEEVKEYFNGRDYGYGDFYSDDGFTTEIWVSNTGEYAQWTRLWDTMEMEG